MSEESVINDFGFTTTTEDLIKRENTDSLRLLHEKVEKGKVNLVQIKRIIFPLLEKLRENPEKDIIKWPNRTTKLNEIMKQIDELIDI